MSEILCDSKTKAKTYVARSEFILHRGVDYLLQNVSSDVFFAVVTPSCLESKPQELSNLISCLRTIAVYDAVFYCIAIMFFSDSQLDGQLFSRGNSSYCFIVKNAGLPCMDG